MAVLCQVYSIEVPLVVHGPDTDSGYTKGGSATGQDGLVGRLTEDSGRLEDHCDLAGHRAVTVADGELIIPGVAGLERWQHQPLIRLSWQRRAIEVPLVIHRKRTVDRRDEGERLAGGNGLICQALPPNRGWNASRRIAEQREAVLPSGSDGHNVR